jgi:hypothetical protein
VWFAPFDRNQFTYVTFGGRSPALAFADLFAQARQRQRSAVSGYSATKLLGLSMNQRE